MKKQSRYNIWIKNILYNSLSNQLILFKKNEKQTIKYYLSHINEFENEHPVLLEKFEQKGFVIEVDKDELDYIFFQNRKATFLDKNCHLTINPTLECNYRCWYCCVEEQGTKHEHRRMDDNTIQKVRKHIKYSIEKEQINKLHLDWFGGEPLMYFKEVIYPLSKYGMKLCKERNIPYTCHITTNAYFINDSMIDAFKEINVSSLQIPIDGHEKKHNSVKKMDNVGHYRQIVQNINALCERIDDIGITLRINYDTQTLKTIFPVIDDINIDNRRKIVVDFQRVWQVDLNTDETGNNSLLLKAKKAFEDAGFHTIYFAFSPKNFACCYADNFYHRVINYDGKIFKCSARDYADDLVIGNLNEDGSITLNENIITKMFNDATFKNKKCLKCKKLPLCYGACVQKYYEIRIGKSDFSCLHDFSEISFEKYITTRALKQIELLKQ